MSLELNVSYINSARKTAQFLAVVAFVLGWAVLIEWIFGIDTLKSVFTAFATMKANTAISFIFAGIALWLGGVNNPKPARILWMRICAGVAALFGLLTLGEYIFATDFGIDQLFFVDSTTPTASFPGRISINTSLNFALLGLALLFLHTHSHFKHGILITQRQALLADIIANVALIGYIYDVQALYHIFPYSSMALPTGKALFHPRHGLL